MLTPRQSAWNHVLLRYLRFQASAQKLQQHFDSLTGWKHLRHNGGQAQKWPRRNLNRVTRLQLGIENDEFFLSSKLPEAANRIVIDDCHRLSEADDGRYPRHINHLPVQVREEEAGENISGEKRLDKPHRTSPSRFPEPNLWRENLDAGELLEPRGRETFLLWGRLQAKPQGNFNLPKLMV